MQIKGFQDVSSMFGLKHFNIVEGVAIDAMHCVYSGVCKAMIGLWFDTSHHTQRWYCGRRLDEVNSKLLAIRPPRCISKQPRSLKERKFWKG